MNNDLDISAFVSKGNDLGRSEVTSPNLAVSDQTQGNAPSSYLETF